MRTNIYINLNFLEMEQRLFLIFIDCRGYHRKGFGLFHANVVKSRQQLLLWWTNIYFTFSALYWL